MEVKSLTLTSQLPTRGTQYSAGYDLYSSEPVLIYRRKTGIIPTGISITLPEGTYGRIAPRSSLAARNGIDVGAGVIDQDYRGEIKVILFNHSNKDFEINEGDRIAQLIITPIVTPEIIQVDELNETERGDGGFGSTGI